MNTNTEQSRRSFIDSIIWLCLKNKFIVLLAVIFLIIWGIMVAPFDWKIEFLPRNPVPVDAIPDIGENQQIVFTEWMGRSPQDIEDQISYPLTVSLLGIAGVKSVRSYSMFGFSTIYVIFKEGTDFYWSRSRLLEKLNSLPAGALPSGVQPSLGPDATALGQVFWYTLEGRDENGKPAGGWDLHELRTIQDYYVRYALMSADGISEVASIGGFVKEYQVDVDPLVLRYYGVTLNEVVAAVQKSNIDVGARTIEVNKVEYVIRGVGFLKSIDDLEHTVIKVRDNTPVYLKTVAHVTLGPALRRGALDKEGAETVGGVVVVRHGENPLKAINNVKTKIREISQGLPSKVLPDGTFSRVTIVPFYDRTGLIYETLETLNTALIEEILVTIIVIILMVMHLRSSLLISGLLPLAVLMCFIAMKLFGVDANIVALSGIAIAIGTMVDMGIIISENILRKLDQAEPGQDHLGVIFSGAQEVGSAVLTAIMTTIVGFLPVFTMTGAEGKLFRPLAFTKTFALLASVIVALMIIPPFAHVLFTHRFETQILKRVSLLILIGAGGAVMVLVSWWIGLVVILIGVYHLVKPLVPQSVLKHETLIVSFIFVVMVGVILSDHWQPLGPERGYSRNFIFVAVVIGTVLVLILLLKRFYIPMLTWCLEHKTAFLSIPVFMIVLGGFVWLGFNYFFGWLPLEAKRLAPVSYITHKFPGLGKEFMPPLDEGSFLLMPTTMPHASIDEVLDVLQHQDMTIRHIPEVGTVVGKLGRAETALDPAPISMIETVINYRSEYLLDSKGKKLTFKFDSDKDDFFRNQSGSPVYAPDGQPYLVKGSFVRDEEGRLIPDDKGKPFRIWRPALDPDLNDDRDAWPGIKTPDDIWNTIIAAIEIPGTTSAPKLQPIATRLVMLQSGMRAPMGIKVRGPSLEVIEQVGFNLERLLKEVPSINPSAVIADRIVGKPYIEIVINRSAAARYGISVRQVQDIIEVGFGGRMITTTVEGRERYPVRIRYMRELRDTIEDLGRILVPAPDGSRIPLAQIADIQYVRGPQMIKSEDTFLVGYVLFDKRPGYAEVDVVEQARNYLDYKIENGELEIPPGVSFNFAGNYENQVRAARTLRVVLPLALFIIFTILYLQFKSVSTSVMVFSGIVVAWAGGFILIWLYAQSWFMDFSIFTVSMRELFQVHPINLSVAVWVGFLALFGIASDNGVVIATYLNQSFERRVPETFQQVRQATIEAAQRRVRPCLMTTATTILALIPVLTSRGRGSDIMVPMAIPSFGGMLLVIITIFVIPVLYCAVMERKLSKGRL
ncbi:MAG: efflux RND transporter permease subunit [Deltaproteobacteria bacterium]|nr:efflux RND transporter permease subunit [Deltaproteobacteria bacterium]